MYIHHGFDISGFECCNQSLVVVNAWLVNLTDAVG